MAKVTEKIIPLRKHSLLYRVNPFGLVGHRESHLSPTHSDHSYDPTAPAYLFVGDDCPAFRADLDPFQFTFPAILRLEDMQMCHVLR